MKFAPLTHYGKKTETQKHKEPSPHQTKKYASSEKIYGKQDKSKHQTA
jgi:hypothetical protein